MAWDNRGFTPPPPDATIGDYLKVSRRKKGKSRKKNQEADRGSSEDNYADSEKGKEGGVVGEDTATNSVHGLVGHSEQTPHASSRCGGVGRRAPAWVQALLSKEEEDVHNPGQEAPSQTESSGYNAQNASRITDNQAQQSSPFVRCSDHIIQGNSDSGKSAKQKEESPTRPNDNDTKQEIDSPTPVTPNHVGLADDAQLSRIINPALIDLYVPNRETFVALPQVQEILRDDLSNVSLECRMFLVPLSQN